MSYRFKAADREQPVLEYDGIESLLHQLLNKKPK
jgi:hypothetical protein